MQRLYKPAHADRLKECPIMHLKSIFITLNVKNLLTIIKFYINVAAILFMKVIKTMSNMVRIQNLATSILPLLLGLALLSLLLKAMSPSFLGRH
jgi:hypothetical protein